VRLIFLFILLILAGYKTAAQQPLVKHLWLNDINTAVKTNDLLQTNDGYIWLATDLGLYRYNGYTFTKIYDKRVNGITALAVWKGKLVAALKNGSLTEVKQDTLVPLTMKGYASKSIIHQIYPDKKDNLWLASESGIVKISGSNAINTYNTNDGLSDDFIYNLAFTTDNKLITATDRGLNHMTFSGSAISAVRVIDDTDGLTDNIVRVIKHSGSGSTYIAGTLDGGISLFDAQADKIIKVKEHSPWAFGQVNDILVINSNKAIASTEEGYIVNISIKKDNDIHYDTLRLQDRKCYRLLLDRSGNVWCATSKGITMLTTEYLEQITLPLPFMLHNVTAMTCDSYNRLWIALQHKLYYVDLTRTASGMQLAHTFAAPVSSLHIDRYNTLWAGTLGRGIFYRTATGKFIRPGIREMGDEHVLSVASDTGSLWIAGLNGVKRISYPDNTGQAYLVREHNKSSGLGSDYVYQLYADSKGTMWMATDGGGVRAYKDGKYLQWPIFGHADNNVAYSICEDAFHRIWAGLLYQDLYRFDNRKWIKVRAEKRDIDAGISTIKANATGQVICVYKRCIDIWYPQSNQFRHFNHRQGLNIDSTSIVLNCGATGPEGNVYLPFQQGILIFKNQEKGFDITPQVHITGIRNYESIIPESKKLFAPEDNYISFAFDGISFSNPERLHYRYKLTGYNDEWIYTRETTATFAKLPPGNYHFTVQVSLNNEFNMVSGDSFSFRIDTPLWKKPWFIIVAFLVAGSAIYVYIRYREKNLKRVSLLEQERILFEYEHLKSQINPHFLFNSLNTLVNLIEENAEAAVNYTTNLSDMYRELLIHRDKNLIPLETEWEILSAYLHIQKSRFGKALIIESSIPHELMSRKRIVPIALQLLVENAIKHNVISLAHPLHITITATEDEITISNTIKPKLTPEPSSGVGLTNIKRRYSLITDRWVTFGATNGKWIVSLPLL